MSLYEQWFKKAYNKDGKVNEMLWDDYMPREQKIYEYVLENKVNQLKGNIKELAEKFDMTSEYMVGFVDGINDILEPQINLQELTEDSDILISIDFEKLYKKMVEYKAEHLYNLPQWKNIFTENEMEELYKGQKRSKTYVREAKIGRNDPCPCGSGKKYKKCCGLK